VTERLPYGTWPSPITPEKVVEGSVSLGELQVCRVGGDELLLWSELRPAEGGRVQVVAWSRDAGVAELLPEGVSARTRVHEYGGGAWFDHDLSLWFSRWDDGRLWRLDDDGTLTAISHEPSSPHGDRFADGRLLAGGFVCVRERHPEDGGEAANEVVVVDPDGTTHVLVSGPDFVASPRPSRGGKHLAWLQWDHPDMPWDAAELWVAEVFGTGYDVALANPRRLLGGSGSSVQEVQWTDDGRLLATTDQSGWWNVVEVPLDGSSAVPLHQDEVEVATPLWVFGQRRFAVLGDGRIACAFSAGGLDHLGLVADGVLTELDTPFTTIAQVVPYQDGVALIAATPTEEATVVHVPLPPEGGAGDVEVLRPRRDLGIDPAWFSAPRPIEFPSEGGRTAHALWYPPTAPGIEGREDEAPPAIVFIHGGPTSSTRAMLSLGTQFWTSRGFAVVDVDYGGSTGYGRPYRELLKPTWGIVDVQDCAAAVQWLAEQGQADGARLAIRGGSAGGFTTLAALITTDVFAVGASLYGVTDLAALAKDTHKFESRYLDGLVGPWPEAEAVYDERSPIHHLDGLDRPVIVFQGLEDEVVPPSQAEALVAALAAKGIEHEYHAFEGEQHGFRKAETVIQVLESELAFYQRVLQLGT
jgi:dipeptidyl aminopeptidase/acylaminoacyl peptidase